MHWNLHFVCHNFIPLIFPARHSTNTHTLFTNNDLINRRNTIEPTNPSNHQKAQKTQTANPDPISTQKPTKQTDQIIENKNNA